MNSFPKYDGNTHPDEWINDIKKYYNVRKLQSLNYISERDGEIVIDESNIIRYGSIVVLKHVATEKYLTSAKDLHYTTGSKNQLVSTGDSKLDPNALWYIYDDTYASKNYVYTKSDICLQHKVSKLYLGNCYYPQVLIFKRSQDKDQYKYHISPTSNHTEVSCINEEIKWKLIHSRMENNQGYLKSNDVVNISIKRSYDIDGPIQDGQVEFLRSHDIQFTIGNETFQEVVCHSERLGGTDEWCIELIKQA
ncbi:hypothetical protein RclHR1_19440003 [Rhizophagus clarus]|uniref:MIR domain-containing protein n=1 Tax=Rhizophagus clarus TaxID=94130 RepID=A0A2Z6QTW4_9GLOM|nr:hypothetical protein RclHR1_19440003 [Rhizophagus clarus]GES94984.1 hypothetical protein GLOIN_2v1767403 [Rhizophagus clarus]